MSPSARMEAYRKAASKLTPKLTATGRSKVGNAMEMATTDAPSSAFSIPDSVRFNPSIFINNNGANGTSGDVPGAAVRSIGSSRRVFLLQSSLTPTEIDGLAYRIRSLSSSDAINSIVVANPLEDAERNGDMTENAFCLPSYLDEEELSQESRGPWGNHYNNAVKSILHSEFGNSLGAPYVSSGYDAKKVYESGLHKDASGLERELMAPLMALSSAVRGSYGESMTSSHSKVPVISLPHGLVTDGGYSLLTGSYVLATDSTSYRMLNPLRGLALDPVGMSYILPRLGWEFRQPSADHSVGCGLMLSLGGYEANAADMVSTGLATHFIGGPYKLNLLERALSEIDSYASQSLHPSRKTKYGHEHEVQDDINDQYKNVAVGNLIQHLSEYDVAGANEYGCTVPDLDDDGMHLSDKDPSLTLPEERIRMYGQVNSWLVNLAATFQDVWGEPTVDGVMERLREIAATKEQYAGKVGYDEDIKVAEAAELLVSNMEKRSPLSLCVTHRLLVMGSQTGETVESCMEREKESQIRLFTKKDGDYVRWAESGKGVGLVEAYGHSMVNDKEDTFGGWNHASVKEVTEDEVKEIIGA